MLKIKPGSLSKTNFNPQRSTQKIFGRLFIQSNNDVELKILYNKLTQKKELFYHDIVSTARMSLPILAKNQINNIMSFKNWLKETKDAIQEKYSSHLYSEGINSTDHIEDYPPKIRSGGSQSRRKDHFKRQF